MNASPFHAGERAIQTRLGVRDSVEAIGARVIRDHMPTQQRTLYGQLPMLLIAAFDEAGSVWASPVFGRPGFISTPDAKTLSVGALPLPGDPLENALADGRTVGVLGIELHSRRRSRLSGRLMTTPHGFDVQVTQTLGNCPKYIHPRAFEWVGPTGSRRHPVTSLDGIAGVLVDQADTFFIATHYSGPNDQPGSAGDVSHRGGRPGFVRVESSASLAFPDYPGNRFFNTLGNIQCDPRAGLLFPDFDRGDLLYLTGTAEIRWGEPGHRDFQSTQRYVRFSLSHGWLLRGAMPLGWSDSGAAPEQSRNAHQTGPNDHPLS